MWHAYYIQYSFGNKETASDADIDNQKFDKPVKWKSKKEMMKRTEWRHRKRPVYPFDELPSDHPIYHNPNKLSSEKMRRIICGHRFHEKHEFERIPEDEVLSWPSPRQSRVKSIVEKKPPPILTVQGGNIWSSPKAVTPKAPVTSKSSSSHKVAVEPPPATDERPTTALKRAPETPAASVEVKKRKTADTTLTTPSASTPTKPAAPSTWYLKSIVAKQAAADEQMPDPSPLQKTRTSPTQREPVFLLSSTAYTAAGERVIFKVPAAHLKPKPRVTEKAATKQNVEEGAARTEKLVKGKRQVKLPVATPSAPELKVPTKKSPPTNRTKSEPESPAESQTPSHAKLNLKEMGGSIPGSATATTSQRDKPVPDSTVLLWSDGAAGRGRVAFRVPVAHLKLNGDQANSTQSARKAPLA